MMSFLEPGLRHDARLLIARSSALSHFLDRTAGLSHAPIAG